MSLTIDSSNNTSTSLPTNTAPSATSGAAFVVNAPGSTTTSASTSGSTSAGPISQLSTDLQSMLTDLQALSSGGSSTSGQLDQAQANSSEDVTTPNPEHHHEHGEHRHFNINETN